MSLNRRNILSGLPAIAAAPLISTSSIAATPPSNGTYRPSGFPAPGLGTVRDSLIPLQMSNELVCTTPQPVFVLPRDHKFHAGQFYATNHFWEWHYWSGFCQDQDGKDYALFFGTDPVGYDPKSGGYAFLPAVISVSPIADKKKHYYFGNFETFKPSHPADATTVADFQYDLSSASGWSVKEAYYAGQERWTFEMRSKDPKAVWCNLEIGLAAPGYIARTPTGIEEEGVDDTGAYNPQTMKGLSYYYIAPDMPFTGDIGFEGKTFKVKGSVWFEHQWGNIKSLDQENCRGRWFSFRFDDGRKLAFRHWMLPPDNTPVHYRNHFCMVHPDGRVEYGYPGKDMRFTPLRSFSVEGVDAQWNPEGLMETPWGDFYLKALVEDSVFVSNTGMMFWEGPMSIHQASSNGAKIGLAYVEQYFQPRGGPEKMRIMPEQDLGRERPLGGVMPK